MPDSPPLTSGPSPQPSPLSTGERGQEKPRGRWGWWVLAIVVIAAAGAATFWMMHRPRVSSHAAGPAMLVVSGDTAGWITPCGCTSNQSGGLLRRGTYLRTLRKDADVLYADAGGAPAGASAYQLLKFEALLKGEMAMGIAAHNIGGPEALLGVHPLRDLVNRLKCPLISANARDRTGQLLAAQVHLAELGGKRVLLIGVLSPRFAAGDVLVDDPKTAVLSALSIARGGYDVAVVLAYMPEDELAQLAADLPEVDAVIGGPTGQAIAPHRVGPSLLAAATNKGKFLVQIDIPSNGSNGRLGGKVVELGPAFGDDDAQLANLHDFLHGLADRDFTADQTGFAPPLPPNAPADYRVAGSASCRACHEPEMKIWAASGHAHAWETLKPRGFEVDPDCLQCHTTGYGLPGGFNSVRITPLLAGDGCENCHGPSLAHVKEPKTRTPFVAADQCVRCHDHENSPNFDFATHWPRIRHEKPAAGTRAAGARSDPEVRP